jgi:hypothetical protein
MSLPLPRPVEASRGLLGRVSNVLSRAVEGGVVLLGPAMDTPAVLADSAAMLWEVLETPRTVEAVIETLAVRYGVEEPVIAGEVETAIGELIALGLIARV